MTTAIAPTSTALVPFSRFTGTAGANADDSAELTLRMTHAVNRMRAATVDAVTSTRALTPLVIDDENVPVNQRVVLECATANGPVRIALMDGAHEQLAAQLEIDRRYYNKLREHHPDMLAYNIGELMMREPQKRMLRMLNPQALTELQEMTGRVGAVYAARAVVSDKYKPIDNSGIIDVLLPAAQQNVLRLVEYQLDERKFHLRFAGPERSIAEIRRAHGFADDARNFHALDANGKDRAWVNEVMALGVAIGNSETGHGAVQVREYSRILRCLNGYVAGEVSRTRHVGGRQEEAGFIAADTRRLELAATYAKVRDQFVEAVGEAKQKLIANNFADAMGMPVIMPEEMPLMEFVDVIGKRFAFSDKERELLQEEVVHEMVEAGVAKPSRFSIAQGFTAVAKRAPEGGFVRKQEIEAIGWQIIADPTSLLIKAAGDAVKAGK